jgi:hypothetical protein
MSVRAGTPRELVAVCELAAALYSGQVVVHLVQLGRILRRLHIGLHHACQQHLNRRRRQTLTLNPFE